MNTAPHEILSKALHQLGLSDGEIAVYKAALGTVPRPVSTIAKRAGMHRAHTYDILSALAERGLVRESARERVRQFASADPNVVLCQLRQREEQLRSERQHLERVLPYFADDRSDGTRLRSSIRVLGYQSAWNELALLSERHPARELRAFLDLESLLADPARADLYRAFDARRLAAGVQMHVVAARRPERAEPPSGTELPDLALYADVFVCGQCSYFFAATPRGGAVVIESEVASSSLNSVHRWIWKRLENQ